MEAIFSSKRPRSKKETFTGAAGVLAGIVLSILAILPKTNPMSPGPSTNGLYTSLTLGSLGLLLLICGCGAVAFTLSQRRPTLSNPAPIEGHTNISELEGALGHLEPERMFGPGSRIGVVAFIQSLVLVVLYSGFVKEYDSNSTMEIWIRSNFPIAQSVLNWEGLLILSASLGVMLIQFLPGRLLSEQWSAKC